MVEVSGEKDRQALEDGVEVQFVAAGDGQPEHTYRVGDYWTFPARVATGDVVWPKDGLGKPAALPPQGPRHHYAPLAWFPMDGDPTELRRQFPVAHCLRIQRDG